MYWIVIFVCHICAWSVEAEGGAFLVTRFGETRETACVQTGDYTRSGLAWASSADSLQYVVEDKPRYVPPAIPELIKCSLTAGDRCKRIWKDNSSFEFPFAPRTDSVWNDFKNLISVKYTYDDIPAENKLPIKFREFNDHKVSYISASVKVASSAHVVFCDGQRFLNSRCYVVIISTSEDRRMSVIRKCVAGMPADQARDGSQCAVSRANVTHNPPLLDGKLWRHFTFALNQSATMTELKVFTQDANGRHKVILEYKDSSAPIKPRFFGVKSLRDEALWKIHEYTLLRTESTTSLDEQQLFYFVGKGANNNLHLLSEDLTCLQMAVAMCTTCSLQLSLSNGKKRSIPNTVVRGRDRASGDGLIPWKEERFYIQFDGTWNRSSIGLNIITTKESSTTDEFWAIDNIRRCAPDEMKILMASEYYSRESCQILDHDVAQSAAAYDITQVTDVQSAPDCSRWFNQSKSCRGVAILTVGHNKHTCYPGYNGDDCTEKTKLETTFEKFSANYTNLTIRPRALNPTGTTADYMKIQYQYHNRSSQGNPWSNISEPLPLTDYLKEFTIPADVAREHLISGEETLVRIILYVDGERDYEDAVPGASIAHMCVRIKSRYASQERSIQIMQELNGNACPLSHYDIRIANLHDARVHCESYKEECTVSGLQPYTSYNITYSTKKTGIVLFWDNVITADGAPGPVVNLEQYSVESDSVSVRWKPPHQPPGVLQCYIVNVHVGNGPAFRTDNITARTHCPLWEDYICHTIDQLKKEVYYTIEVYAHTRNLRPGEKASISHIQFGQKPPGEPADLHVKDATSNEISWRHPRYPNGKIRYFEITSSLKSTELITTPNAVLPMRKTITEDQREYSYMLEGLAPASTYTVKVTAHNEYEGKPAEIEITTSLVPPDVTGELQVQKLHSDQMEIVIPPADAGANITKNSGVYVIVSEIDPEDSLEQKIAKQNDHKERFRDLWKQAMISENTQTVSWVSKMIREIPLINSESKQYNTIIIGTNTSIEDGTWDAPLSENSKYTISVVYYNEINEMRAYTVLKNDQILEIKTNYLWYLLPVLLLLLPILLLTVFLICRRKNKRSEETGSRNISATVGFKKENEPVLRTRGPFNQDLPPIPPSDDGLYEQGILRSHMSEETDHVYEIPAISENNEEDDNVYDN